jgi:hypothetical protein
MKAVSCTVSIIIVTWNSEKDISRCLSSLYASTRNIQTEIIVVDNKSSDQTVRTIRTHYPAVRVLKQKTNHGFGQGNNLGLKKAKGTYVLLLNPDTVMNSHALYTMKQFLESHPHVGVVGPEQVNDDGNMIFMTSRVSPLGISEYVIERAYRHVFNKTKILFPIPHKTPMLNAGCLLMRSSILPTRQWFHPGYFLYGEESHLFRQVKKQRWGVYFLRNCSIIHSREKSIMQTKNKAQFALSSVKTLLMASFISKNSLSPKPFL